MLGASKLDRCFRSARDCLNTVHALKERRASFFLLDLAGGGDDLSGNGQSGSRSSSSTSQRRWPTLNANASANGI
jgi:DNA invertase Pin-like site-specific DNA recombinase